MIATNNLEPRDCRTGGTITAKREQSGTPPRAANRFARPIAGEVHWKAVASHLDSFGSDAAALAPDVALAVGVLRQAARDLHTFHSAQHGIERELYLDACHWIIDEDHSWPYSFLNVCASLRVSADVMRAELLADAPLRWYAYWKRIIGRRAKSLRLSIGTAFRAPQTA